MPQIKEYTTKSEVKGPTASAGRNATGNAPFAQGLESLGKSIENVGDLLYQRKEQNEVSDLNAKMSEAHAAFTNDLQETLRTADPGDQTIAQTFNDKFDDYMGKISDDISTRAGRQYFQKTEADLKGHFLTSAMAGQAELAGVKAKEDYHKTLNNLSSTVISDPSSLDQARQMHSDAIDNLVNSKMLPTHVAEKLKVDGDTEMTKSAIRGWINLDPEQTKKELASGKWDTSIDGDLKHQLDKEADQEIRGRDADTRRAEAEKQKALGIKQMTTQNEFLVKMNEGKLTFEDIKNSNLDPFGSGSKETFIQMMNTHAEHKIQMDPGTFIDLFQKIHLPNGDPKKIVDENDLNGYLGKGLSLENIQQLRNEMQGKRTIEGSAAADLKKGLVDIAKGKLTRSNPLLGIKDPDGDEQLQKFMSKFLYDYDDQKKKGKSDRELLDPNSPDYLGKMIGQFTKTPQQIVQGLTQSMKNKAQPQPVVDQNAVPTNSSPTPPPKKVLKKEFSKKLNKSRITYDDGTVEEVNGR